MTVTYTYSVSRLVQTESPSSGDTIQIDNGGLDTHIMCTPTSTLATLTFNFPTDANYLPAQIIRIFSSHEITSVNWTNASNVVNAPNTILANTYVEFMKTAFSNTWCGNT